MRPTHPYDIKPCPWCSSEDVTPRITRKEQCFLECDSCGARSGLYGFTDIAVWKWNDLRELVEREWGPNT